MSRGQTKVSEFDDDFAFIGPVWECGASLGNDEVLGFEVTMVYILGMYFSDSIAHLREHRRYETEASLREELGGM